MSQDAAPRRAATGPARLGLGVVALALLGGVAGCGAIGGDDQRTMSADFSRAVGLYKASDVRILGVRIGEVTKIEPRGTSVRVTMTYDAKYKIPADAKALVVAPSIVSDRYVQLTPTYSSGPVLAEGANLTVDSTNIPIELDEIYASLDKLNLALGPNGANKNGALNDLLEVGAKNLDGNGALLNSTLKDFATLVSTVNGNRDDLFGTVRGLQDFTTTIANSDSTVRAFNRDLAAVAAQLSGERQDLATAVKQLSVALGEVATFVRDNKASLTSNVTELSKITGVLVKQRKALEEFLDVAPTALSNLQLAYNPESGTLDTRDNNAAGAESSPLSVICNVLLTAGQDASMCDALAAGLPIPPPPGTVVPKSAVAPQPTGRDLSLGGILDGGR